MSNLDHNQEASLRKLDLMVHCIYLEGPEHVYIYCSLPEARASGTFVCITTVLSKFYFSNSMHYILFYSFYVVKNSIYLYFLYRKYILPMPLPWLGPVDTDFFLCNLFSCLSIS